MYELKAGTGKTCINVPEGLFPFPIYANSYFDCMGDSGDLYARALLIDNGTARFLFVATDVSDAPGIALRKRIEDAYGIPEDHMFVTAAHNHSAPHGGGRKGGGMSQDPNRAEKEAAYAKIYEEGILLAVKQAVENLRPARYGFGEGKSYININRDLPLEDGYWTQGQNYAGTSDKTLAALKFVDEDGKLIGAVLNYACHGTTAFCVKDSDGKIKVTPGFAGIACSYIEARYDNEPVILWTNGASGDQNPINCSEGYPRHYDPDGYTESVQAPAGTQYMIQRNHGWTHAIDAIRVLNGIDARKDKMKITVAETQVELEAQKKPEGADMFLNKLFCDNTVRIFRPDLCVNGKAPAKKLVKMVPDGTIRMPMRLALLGDMGWIGVYGEPYSMIGLKCKAAAPIRNTVLVLHVDDTCGAGYILDDASRDHTVFQSFSRVKPGNSDGPIVNGVLDLYEKALNS